MEDLSVLLEIVDYLKIYRGAKNLLYYVEYEHNGYSGYEIDASLQIAIQRTLARVKYI